MKIPFSFRAFLNTSLRHPVGCRERRQLVNKRVPIAKRRFTFDLFKRGPLFNKGVPKRMQNISGITVLTITILPRSFL